jgi:hypothetical protein
MIQTLVLLAAGMAVTLIGLTLLSGGPETLPARLLRRVLSAMPHDAKAQHAKTPAAKTTARERRKGRYAGVQEKLGWLFVGGGAVVAAFGIFG